MKLIAGCFLFFAFATHAAVGSACSDPVSPSFTENLRTAKNVFVFRLVSLELIDDERPSSRLRGNIKIVRTLKGAPATSAVTYDASACCSVKLSVGRHYIAALDGDRPILELVPGDQSILDVTDDFSGTENAGTHGAIDPIQDFLSGKPLPAGFPGEYRLESTISCPSIPAVPDYYFNSTYKKGDPIH